MSEQDLKVLADLLAALDRDYYDDGQDADHAPVDFFGECGETALTWGHIRGLRDLLARTAQTGADHA